MINMAETNAFATGVFAVLFGMLIHLFLIATQDDFAVNQRAKRLAIATSSAATIAIAGGVIATFLWGNRILANFVTMPAIASGLYVLLFCPPKLYRLYGGGAPPAQQTRPKATLPEHIDQDTQEQQAELRKALIALPHFRETLEGDVVSLITGDRVFWSRYHATPCLAIELSAKNTVSCVRLETLWSYVEIQRRIAGCLMAEHSSSSPS